MEHQPPAPGSPSHLSAPAVRPVRVRLPLLMVFTALTATLTAVFLITLLQHDRTTIDRDMTTRAEAIRVMFDQVIDIEDRLQLSLLSEIAADAELAERFENGDRDGLYDRIRPHFSVLRQEFHITHLYFHQLDQTAFLRVHHPTRFGDTISRTTMRHAVETGAPYTGLEMGLFGTFTLRTVIPWRVDGRLIGYLEAGQEIERLVEDIGTVLDAHILIALDKANLNEESWREGRMFRGYTTEWDALDRMVIAGGAQTVPPTGFLSWLADTDWTQEKELSRFEADGRAYTVAHQPLHDVTDKLVGWFIILVDTSPQVGAFRSDLAQAVIVSGLALLFGIGVFFISLGRIQRELVSAHDNLDGLVRERTGLLQGEIYNHRKTQSALQDSLSVGNLLFDAAVTANEADTPEEAVQQTLRIVAAHRGWQIGQAYVIDETDADLLKLLPGRHEVLPPHAASVEAALDKAVFVRGVGLPGQALAAAQPQLFRNLAQENDPRADALAEIGLKGGIALPIMAGRTVYGAMEFLVDIAPQPDSSLMKSLMQIGTQLGRVFERHAAGLSLKKLSTGIEQSPLSILITNVRGEIEYVNSAFTASTGYSLAEAKGKTPRITKSDMNPPGTYEDLWGTINSGHRWEGELYNKRKDGTHLWEWVVISPITEADGSVSHFIAMKQDISLRKGYEEQLVRQANYHRLTGLPNRMLMQDRLSAELSRSQGNTAVLLINVNKLGRINDAHSHEIGDKVLTETARRIQSVLTPEQSLGALESDEFLAILPGISASVYAEITAKRIQAACAAPVNIDDLSLWVTVRIGITMAPADGKEAFLLIRNAHAAALRAKESVSADYSFFTPTMDAAATRMLAVEGQIKFAVQKEEFELHYQPLIDVRTRRIIGAEALLRWTNRELGQVSPGEFIPIAEASGLIGPISQWVVTRAIEDLRQLLSRIETPFHLSVNLSAAQFSDGGFVERIGFLTEVAGVPNEALELELTEGMMMTDPEMSRTLISALRGAGFRISLDDFGTGYSSLAYLKKFPLDTLKIDRAFIKDIETDDQARSLVRAIQAMATGLDLTVIAEGIETPEQFRLLEAWGCDIAQGFLFSPAVPLNDFIELALATDPFAAALAQHADQDLGTAI